MQTLIDEMVGNTIILRLVEEDDAEFVWDLRNDPHYNTHLSKNSGTVEDQKLWIRSYKQKEAAGTEFYFIVLRKDDRTRCGTIRVYGISDHEFTWGSWILDENKPAKAALDSALQIYKFAFDILGLQKAVFDVRKENVRTLAFHDRFGSQRTGETELDILYEFSNSMFVERAKYYARYFR